MLSWLERESTQVQFAVGFKIQGKTGHVVVDAEDALIAALKVRAYGVLSARAEACDRHRTLPTGF